MAKRPKEAGSLIDQITGATGEGARSAAGGEIKLPPVKPPDLSEFEKWGRKVKELSQDAYGALKAEWVRLEGELKSEDPATQKWAEMRAQALLSTISNAIAQFGGDWSKAAAAASIEVKSGYKTIRDRFTKELSEFEKFGQELAEMTDDALAPLKAEWANLAKAIASEDATATDRTWAEARASALAGAIKDALLNSAGDTDVAFAAAAKVLEDGYTTLQRESAKGQSELAKTMATFRYDVAIGALKGTGEQINELERIRKSVEYNSASLEEQRQLEVQLYGLREDLRAGEIRSAYEEYQFKAQLLDYEAADHVTHLNQLLANEKLSAEESKKLNESLQLWQKKQTDEEAAYKKTVNDAWNAYYLETGKKTQADLLRETVATRQAELKAAREANKGVAEAEAKLAQARVALNAQLRRDDEDRMKFQAAMGVATYRDQLTGCRRACGRGEWP